MDRAVNFSDGIIYLINSRRLLGRSSGDLGDWTEAADLLIAALEKTISEKKVTYDLERQMEGATLLKCSEFGKAVAENI